MRCKEASNAAGDVIETRSVDNIFAVSQTITVEMEYDAYGRKKKSIDPDKGTWEYTYNAFGDLVEQTDAKDQRITMSYDVLGRMRTRVGYALDDLGVEKAVENSTWTYDDAGVPLGGPVPGLLRATSHTSKTTAGVETSNEFKLYSYDSRGRSTGAGTILTLDGTETRDYAETLSYDEHGRVFQHFDMTGSDRGTENEYNARGYLYKVKEAFFDSNTPQVTYIRNDSMDALGNVTSHLVGSRTINQVYDPITGRLKQVASLDGLDYSTSDHLILEYDVLGNLKSRHRTSGNPLTPVVEAKERYCYDNLNRLIERYDDQLTGSCPTTGSMVYDAFGNLTEKNGQTYTYPTAPGAVRPHAVTSVGTTAYTYDDNGNMEGGDGRTFSYSVFDQMTLVEKDSNTLEFGYGIDRKRTYREETVDAVTTKTFYMGSAERVETGTTVEIRRRIGGEVVITHTLDAGDNLVSRKARYQMLDHLGSPVAVYDGSAAVQERLSFGTWGNRRDYDTLVALDYYNTAFVSGSDTDTVRGYTGHEHGDAFGIIHMNGRIYDPHLGRMLQADPFIQSPTNTQSYNRYSYVLNNPLSLTDPSGYFSLKDAFKIVAVVAISVATYNVASAWAMGAAMNSSTIMAGGLAQASIVAGAAGGAAAGFAAGVSMAAFSGASGAEAFRAGLKGAMSGAVFGGIGGYYRSTWNMARVSANTLAGGVNSRLSGGRFIEGASFALVTSMLAYTNYKMRQIVIENSSNNPRNINGKSAGLYSDGKKVGGGREELYRDANGNIVRVDRNSTMGGSQGHPIPGTGDLRSRFGPTWWTYEPNSIEDHIVESFAGPHDWMRGQTGSYITAADVVDPAVDIIGNSKHFVGFDRVLDEFRNYALVVPAAPFAAGALIDSTSTYGVFQEYLR